MSDPWTPEDDQNSAADRPNKRIKITSPETSPSPSSPSSPDTPSSSSSSSSPSSPISSAPQSPSSPLSSSSEVSLPTSDPESTSISTTVESTIGTEVLSPAPSESEYDKLVKEYTTMQEYMEGTLTRLRRDVTSFKSMVALKESQNMDRLKVLKNKIDKFPENEIAMLQVVLIEMLRRNSRRANSFADALEGLVEIHDSCESECANGNKFSITYITS